MIVAIHTIHVIAPFSIPAATSSVKVIEEAAFEFLDSK